MLGKVKEQQDFFDNYLYENLLPERHILLDIKRMIDFSFVEEELKDLYDASNGRPSYPPEVLFKILFLEYYYNLSDVEVVMQCRVNVLYRYFIGLSVQDSIPDDSTLVVFRARCGQERFERLFDRVVKECMGKGLLKERVKIVDATSVEGDIAIPNTVNLLRQGRRVIIDRVRKRGYKGEGELSRYYVKERLHKKPKANELKEEISVTKDFVGEVRGRYGGDIDELLDWLEELYKPERDRGKICSFIDTDCRHGVKSPRRMFSGYKAHVAIDESGIVTSVDLLSGNRNEAGQLNRLLDKEEAKGIKSEAVVADAQYDSAVNRKDIQRRGMKAYIPLRRKNNQSKGFIYDSKKDKLICPCGVVSKDVKNRQGRGQFYNFAVEICKKCKSKCEGYKGNRSRIYISDDYRLKLENDDSFYFEAMELRKGVERKFGEAKKWHGLRRARYRGKWRVAIQCLMTFLVLNVKRMIKLIKEDQRLGSLQTDSSFLPS